MVCRWILAHLLPLCFCNCYFFQWWGIPGSGLVKILLVANTFGFPVELVGIIAGFYRLLDMPCTAGNCLGDLAGTVFVGKWEEKDLKKQIA
jgi:Na+/H+-dicarboxylate symporter